MDNIAIETSSNVGLAADSPKDSNTSSHTVTCGVFQDNSPNTRDTSNTYNTSNTHDISNAHDTSGNNTPPQLEQLSDLFTDYVGGTIKSQIFYDILAYSEKYPSEEHIYKFDLGKFMDTYTRPHGDSNPDSKHNNWIRNCVSSLQNGEDMNCIVAGSYALWVLEKMIGDSHGWKPSDMDFFLLGREQHARHNPFDGLLDIVHTKEKTPCEVISNFDLPCCRVAFDMNYTFYVSIHALTAILTGKVFIPEYLLKPEKFKSILQQYVFEIPPDIPKLAISQYHDQLISRMGERIKKYQSRGFSIQKYETSYILPWIKERFTYVDFDMMKQPEMDLDGLEKMITTLKSESSPSVIAKRLRPLHDLYRSHNSIMAKLDLIENVSGIAVKHNEYMVPRNKHLDQLFQMIVSHKNTKFVSEDKIRLVDLTTKLDLHVLNQIIDKVRNCYKGFKIIDEEIANIEVIARLAINEEIYLKSLGAHIGKLLAEINSLEY